jgi:hypothetical protein
MREVAMNISHRLAVTMAGTAIALIIIGCGWMGYSRLRAPAPDALQPCCAPPAGVLSTLRTHLHELSAARLHWALAREADERRDWHATVVAAQTALEERLHALEADLQDPVQRGELARLRAAHADRVAAYERVQVAFRPDGPRDVLALIRAQAQGEQGATAGIIEERASFNEASLEDSDLADVQPRSGWSPLKMMAACVMGLSLSGLLLAWWLHRRVALHLPRRTDPSRI